MKNIIAGLLAASLVPVILLSHGCQLKPNEEVALPGESRGMVGETIDKGKEMVQESIMAGKEIVEATVEQNKEMVEEMNAQRGGDTKMSVQEAAADKVAEMETKSSGETLEEGKMLFKKYCAVCHPDGGNIINTKKTLSKKDLEANNINKGQDIVNIMRNPGPGMNKFPEDKISNEDAMKIAAYILHAFQ